MARVRRPMDGQLDLFKEGHRIPFVALSQTVAAVKPGKDAGQNGAFERKLGRYPPGATCIGPQCAKKPVSNWLCDGHRRQRNAEKDLTPLREKRLKSDTCWFAGCSYRALPGELCDAHKHQVRRGKTLTPLRQARPRGAKLLRDESGRAHCGTCDEWRPIEAFHPINVGVSCISCTLLRKRASRHHTTIGVLLELLRRGNGACWSCGYQPEVGLHTSPLGDLHVDHDHSCCSGPVSCGKCITALLCATCNVSNGASHDDPLRTLNNLEFLVRSRDISPAIRVRMLERVIGMLEPESRSR